MAPKLGEVVYVNEVDPFTDNNRVSVALVTHVFTEEDANGDTKWWDAVKGNEPLQVTIFRRDGSQESVTVSAGAIVQDDNGEDRWQNGTYSTDPQGPSNSSAPAESSTVTDTPPADLSSPTPGTVSSQDLTGTDVSVPADELAAFQAWRAEQAAQSQQSSGGLSSLFSGQQSQQQNP